MLARAAVRSLRLPSTPASVRGASAYNSLRYYAKNNKPKRANDFKPPPPTSPASSHVSSTQRAQGPVAAAVAASSIASSSKSSDRSGKPDFSAEQDEFQSSTAYNTNTEPSSPSPGLRLPSGQPQQPSPHPDYSTLQDEFQTSYSSAANTTPQPKSPSAIDPAEARQQDQEQLGALPDLTQGIPSTLDAEVAASSPSARLDPASLNVTEDPSKGGPGGDDLPKSAYISSVERRRNKLANWLYASFFGLSIVGTIYLGRNWETLEEEAKHPDAPSGWGFGLFYGRASARLADMLDYYNEPAFPKLLPNPDPNFDPPYTLVLSLEDLLVHSEWSREHGWRMAKRPGVDYFLRYLSQYYELVVFTSVPSMVGEPIIRKLDPYRIIRWPLFREATRYKNGEYIKDLVYLNRDLKKIILVDTVDHHAKLQPENAIIIPKWKGDPQDKELVSLIPFLEYVASMDFKDTREVLKSFEGKRIPAEFASREAVARERFQEQLAEERAKRPKRSGVGFLGSALGIKPVAADGMDQSFSDGFAQGKTYQDLVRERGRKGYELLEKEIRENGDKWLKEMAAEEKKLQEEAMKGMKSGVLGFFSGGGGGQK